MRKPLYELYMREKNTPLTDQFIEESFHLMIEEEPDIKPFITDFRIEDSKYNNLGYYSNDDQVIKIYKNNIISTNNNQLLALKAIRNEIEHARNLKILQEGKKDIESLVVYYSLRDYAMREGINTFPNLDNLYELLFKIEKNNNKEIDPGERLANIKAWKYLVNFLKSQRYSNDLSFVRGNLHDAYIRGYYNNTNYQDAPTYEFLFNTGMHQDLFYLKERVKRKDYSFATRITYGLPITYTEYKDESLRKVLLKK